MAGAATLTRPSPVSATADLVTGQLERFEPVALDSPSIPTLMSRIDTKVALPIERLPVLLAHLPGRSGDGYRVVETPGGLAPYYSTLYLDTPDLRLYQDHHNQRRQRYKLRYRRYHSTDTIFFEVKRRTNSRRTSKSRVEMGAIPWTIGQAERALAGQVGVAIEAMRPTLNVAYRRLTLVGAQHRVTIDLGLTYHTGKGRTLALHNRAIIEIKQARREPFSPIAVALRTLGLRPHSISKYCIGVAACIEGVKRNRFEPRLRQLVAR